MLLGLLVGSLAHYHFQALDFIPNDINDKGWIVGETRVLRDYGFRKSAVLLRDGRKVDLGTYGDSGSAVRVNDRGHILIACEPSAVPKALIPNQKKAKGVWGSAFLFWANGKTTYVGEFTSTGRLLKSDRFLARKRGAGVLVTIKNRKVVVSPLPTVPSPFYYSRSRADYEDMNEAGTLVGSTDFGQSRSHAIRVDSAGRVTDLHPSVDMHTGWTASHINKRGDILGYHAYDSSVGGGSNFLWRNGKVKYLPSVAPYSLSLQAASLNDCGQALGVLWLFDSWAKTEELQNAESISPYTATPTTHAMLWDDDRLINLNEVTDKPEDCVLTTATKINNRGWIIGTAVREGKRIGFLLTPIARR